MTFSPIDELKRQMTLPFAPERIYQGECDPVTHLSVYFDPWEVFPCFYGVYSSDFDDVAILVLDNMLNKRFGGQHGESVAHEMFREVLCTSDLCDYGTSPRGCFPNWGSGFDELLPGFLEKWKQYRQGFWGDGE